MAKPRIDVAIEKATYLGEGPHWRCEHEDLLFVDILGKSINRFDPKTKAHHRLKFDSTVSLVVPLKFQKNKMIASVGRELVLVDWDGKSNQTQNQKTIATVDDHSPRNRFNDGKCDPKGRLWAGTMGYEPVPGQLDRQKGALYSIDSDIVVRKHADKIDIANGLAWTADGSTMYYIDTMTYRVDAFDYDIHGGTISNRRSAFDFKKNSITGLPDGMTIDRDGILWIACFAGSQIIKVDPTTGKLLQRIEMPCSNPTSVVFGGPHLDTIYVTSTSFGLDEAELATQPLAGSLFTISGTGAKGFHSEEFVGDMSKLNVLIK